MEIQPSDRLKEFLELKELSFSKFALKIDAPKLIYQANKYIGEGKKSTLKGNYGKNFFKVDLNYNWYLTGEGSMLLSEYNLNAKQSVPIVADTTVLYGLEESDEGLQVVTKPIKGGLIDVKDDQKIDKMQNEISELKGEVKVLKELCFEIISDKINK